jgi:TRAP-type C4-dicarboxylate transport system permease small subunit
VRPARRAAAAGRPSIPAMSGLYAAICRAELTIAKYALALLAALVFAAAVARTLGHPVSWAIDAATFLFAWCVFLGGDVAIRQDKLFTIVVVTARLPWKAQVVLNIVNYVIIAVFLLAMIGYGSYLSYVTRVRPFQGIPGFSYTWVTISVPIGCTLMLISVIQRIRSYGTALREGVPIRAQQASTEVL